MNWNSLVTIQERQMRIERLIAAVLMVVSALALCVIDAQEAGTKRTDLQRHDLSAAGREVIQVRVDFDPDMWLRSTRIPGRRSST